MAFALLHIIKYICDLFNHAISSSRCTYSVGWLVVVNHRLEKIIKKR
jgi:hypothetical protein